MFADQFVCKGVSFYDRCMKHNNKIQETSKYTYLWP